ncbi:MAG: NADH-quinone oxidoreductase subunit L [Alphaproteobacteria bacterium]|nr:NADH-quinone oxidoreductase subunit L [Alphaproteobacteria bacterium]
MEAAVVFLPLLGAIIAGFFGRMIGDKAAQFITCAFLVLSAVISFYLFYAVALGGDPRTVVLFEWVTSGELEFFWSLKVDTLTAVMLIVVTTVSAVVHIYSIGYMSHDGSIPRFMAYLSLFTFFMLMLVTADNLVQLFFGWEGVGLCSYLLIGFWYDRPSANAAAIKAFLVNRVGDIGFALGIFAIFVLFDTVRLDAIFAAAAGKADATLVFLGFEFHALTIICLLLFIGAMGKSAQLGLHTWLPDAMEGPTPVSALIHAATMVTAGVFMVVRLSPLFEQSDTALMVVTVVGASTAFVTATIGLTQNDIKRVIAYSTCSQLGYMFFAIGVSAYPAAIFHLMTHAFFKALLFLGSGSVIHAMSDEQDMRKMGGLWKLIPVTYALMWIGSLALAGIGIPGTLIGFAGFFSKDVILESAFAAHTGVGTFAFWLGIAAAFMTAFYSCRLLFMTFHGQPRCDEKTLAHVHESPRIMIWPLFLLAAGAIFSGAFGYHLFVGDGLANFWGDSIAILPTHTALADAHHVPVWVKVLPLVMVAGGIGLAYWMYMVRTDIAAIWAEKLRPAYLLSYNKWYFDEIYERLFVRPAFYLGRGFWKAGDGALIDGVGPDGIAATTIRLARRASALQSGYLYHYAFAMLIGVVVLVTFYFFTRTGG